MAAYKFDREAKDRFLKKYSETGRKYVSCRAAGVSEETVNRFIRGDIEGFAAEFAEARGIYCDKIETEIERRAIDGVPVPIIGGKDRDEIVTYVQEYSDRLLEFHAKKHIPEYREKQQVDLNVTGGVMVVEGKANTVEDWIEANAEVAVPLSLAASLAETEKADKESEK